MLTASPHDPILSRCRQPGQPRPRVLAVSTPRALSFGSVARTYDWARASYPREAVHWVLEARAGDGRRVLDLGAGTGRLSSVLLDLDLDVTAVEPDDAMRALAPAGAKALAGTAEKVPLADGSLDAVLVGQAWHWFDHELALSEVGRVLRPGGVLGLLWNVFDDRVPWVAELMTVTASQDRLSARDEMPYVGAPLPERRTFPHTQAMTRDLLVDNLASRSATVLMTPTDRERFLRQVRDAAPADSFDLPWICETWRARVPE